MSTVDWNTATPIAPQDLPAVITGYLAAQHARDADAAVAACTGDAVVTDDGRTYRGPDEIHAWVRDAASEYRYTTELIAAARVDDAHYDVSHHLEGDFPGGVADLHYRFTLRGTAIARLVIAP